MKKFFYILFSVYFFILAVTPCTDGDDCKDESKSELCQNHQDQEHEDETCTPFCACSCCAVHFLITDFQPIIKQSAEINSVYTIHAVSKVSGAVIPIWQPPKLA